MDNPTNHDPLNESPSKSYALSGKIMLSAIVILFVVVVFMVVLHIYARWYLLRVRRQYQRRRSLRNRATHIVFYVDPNNPNSTGVTLPTRGLDASVLSSIPIFVYSSETPPAVLECAVCLSEFEENEKGRLLPTCQHSFHLDCIDMWFQSHSTCPLCRAPVEPVQVPQPNDLSEVVISVDEPAGTEPGAGSSPGFWAMCQHERGQVGSSSLADRRKGLDLVGVTIEVPRSNDLEDDSRLSSPASQGFKSPGSRLLSLKRILSMNRKAAAVSPSSGTGTSCGPVGTESNIDSPRDGPPTRAQTPR